MNVLEEAGGLVDGPREAAYGHPYDDFSRVASAAMQLHLYPENGPLEHALYMILVKIQRLVVTPDHRDSIVDIAGYARTYEKILDRMEQTGDKHPAFPKPGDRAGKMEWNGIEWVKIERAE